MKRRPSVHMHLDDLVRVLGSIGIKNPQRVGELILEKGLPYAIKDRFLVTGDSALRKKASKAIEVAGKATISVEKFNSILYSCRIDAGHRNISNITKGDAQYTTLTEVATIAGQFSTDCGFDSVEEGCKIYVVLGLRFMKHGAQYGLNKFKYYKDQIYSLYESSATIHEDPEQDKTKQVYELWKKYIAVYGGISRELTKPEDFVYMVYIRMEADAVGAKYEHWVEAQFEFFKAMTLVPNLNQLIGDKALNRYYDYMGKHHKKLKKVQRTHEEAPEDFMQRYEKARKQLAEK